MATTPVRFSNLVFTKGGVTMRDVAVDTAVVDRTISKQKINAVVIEQSIPAGASVLRGTPVDVTLAVTDSLPIFAIAELPTAWAESKLTIGQVAAVAKTNPALLDLLERHDSAATLSAAEQKVLIDTGGQLGMHIDAGDPIALQGMFSATRGAYQLSNGIE